MISNNKYWQNRADERMASYHRNSDETIARINKAYDKAINDINGDIKNIFKNYQINTELSPEECRKMLNSKISNKELVSIKERIKYITDNDIKKQLYAELNSKAYKARITRLEALKDSININTKRVADTELQATTRLYTNNIQNAYYRTLFDIQKGINVGFDVASMSNEQIQEILKNNWSGEHYSKRIWGNSKVFASKIDVIKSIHEGYQIKLDTTGEKRTGCVYCTYGITLEKGENRFQKLYKNDKRKYDFAINGGKLDDKGKLVPGNGGLGMGKVLDLMGVNYKPIS